MKKKLIITSLISVLVIIFFTVFNLVYVANKENKTCLKEVKLIEQDKTINTNTERNSAIKKLKKELDGKIYLSNYTKAEVNSVIVKFYSSQNDLNNTIDYLIKSINYANKIGDSYIVAKNFINMSVVLINNGEFETAEEMLKYADTLYIGDTNKNYKIKKRIEINLADAYSRNNENNRALNTIKGITIDDKVSATEKNIINIIKARALLQNGDLAEAEEIINDINISKNDKNINLIEEYVPYLSLKAQIAFEKGSYDDGFKLCNEYLNLFPDGENDIIKLIHLRTLVDKINDHRYEFSKETIFKYNNELVKLYEKVSDEKSSDNIKYMLDKFKYELYSYQEVKKKYMRVIFSVIFLIAILLFIFYLIFVLRKVKRESYTDGLTQVKNRRSFNDSYNKYIEDRQDFVLAIIDIDDFKKVNDNFGHAFGDRVLKVISKTIQKKLGNSHELFRYGGEEFCILSSNISIKNMVSFLEKIRKEIEYLEWERDTKITISIGVASSRVRGNTFRRADDNLYKSKRTGKNKISY